MLAIMDRNVGMGMNMLKSGVFSHKVHVLALFQICEELDKYKDLSERVGE
ncbi:MULTISPECIES: hypothetical protein [unclassified Saccharicrinis]